MHLFVHISTYEQAIARYYIVNHKCRLIRDRDPPSFFKTNETKAAVKKGGPFLIQCDLLTGPSFFS